MHSSLNYEAAWILGDNETKSKIVDDNLVDESLELLNESER